MSDAYAVLLVDSTSHAVRIEKILAQAGIACRLIPVPRQLSSDCGVCVRVQQDDAAAAQELAAAAGVQIAGFHLV
jgi:hypothetical protein